MASLWLNRIGIVALVGGLAALLLHAFPALPVEGKLAIGLGIAAALTGLGVALRRRYRIFGQVLMSGGLALVYFDAYAVHFIPGLRLFDSPYPSLVLMGLVVVAILTLGQHLRSESVAGMALFLGYATALFAGQAVLTLPSLAMLAAASVFLLLRNRWVVVPISSCAFVYISHLLWMTGYMGEPWGFGQGSLGLGVSTSLIYFGVFAAAPLITRAPLSQAVQWLLGGINMLGVVLLLALELSSQQLESVSLWLFPLAAVSATLTYVALRHGLRAGLADLYALAALLLASAALATILPHAWVGIAWVALGAGSRHLRTPPALSLAGTLLVLLGAALQLTLSFAAPHHALLLAAALIILERLSSVARAQANSRQAIAALATYGDLVSSTLLGILSLAALLAGAWLTVAWTLMALSLFVGGLVFRSRLHRLAALALLALTLFKIVSCDLAQLTATLRIASMVLLGLVLLVVSFLYTRLEHQLQR